jgi:hypothetical protein
MKVGLDLAARLIGPIINIISIEFEAEMKELKAGGVNARVQVVFLGTTQPTYITKPQIHGRSRSDS